MKFIDFFAGIGGFRRGMELAGHECVGFCEFNENAVFSYISMHLLIDEQKAELDKIPAPAKKNGSLNFSKRHKYLKSLIKENSINGEWYANDIRTVDSRDIPNADCWCAGFPCQDISVAGKQLGFDGNRSSLYFQIIRLIKGKEEKDRPEWIFLENVKNLLSVNNGWDFARVLFALDEVGYDAEWGTLNSKHFHVPQNRERVFIIGHSRRFSPRKIFPVTGTDGENSVQQLGQLYGTDKEPNPSGGRFYGIDGFSPTTGSGHGMSQPQIALPCFTDMTIGQGINLTENARILCARYQEGMTNHEAAISGVAIPVIDVAHIEKNQNGKRFKENGDPMFTLTAQDRHGVGVDVLDGCYTNKQYDGIYIEIPEGFTVYAVWYEKYQCYIAIRRLTPKECFRLQGWTDDYFEKAAFVNSDSQLYKQAGNGVSVPVIYEIGKKLRGSDNN